MFKHTSIIIFTLLVCLDAVAQQSLQPLLSHLNYPAITPTKDRSIQSTAPSSFYSPHLSEFFNSVKNNKAVLASFQSKQFKSNAVADTIIVGLIPNDTLRITGTYNHNGPIWVIGTGVLIVHNANVTNTGGDLVVWNGKAFIDSSTLHFPQTYFYERAMILAGGAYVSIQNTTLNYDSLSHNMTVTDSSQLVESNMVLKGFTTTGISSKAAISIDGTNQAGEFIITDRCKLNLKNSTEVLLWHQFPDSAVINWSFGKSDTAYNYRFNNGMAGVKGIEYDVTIDSCYKIMWAMMPSSGSNITINNSKMRAIGLWFDKKNDSIVVNGIYDSTYYSSSTIPLSDRTLKLNDCYVQTWSLYVFNNSKINVSNCQVGEIGAQQTAKVYGNNYWVDGTGGYHWTTDSALAFVNGLVNYSYVRSEKNSVFIVGYSAVVKAMSISKSILIIVQTTLLSDPLALEGGVTWYATIDQPAQAYTNSTVNITGSAWIDRGPSSTLMDFKSWRLYYQKQSDTTWTPISPEAGTEVRHNLLGAWNTIGLTAGTYTLRLSLKSTWGDSVDAYLVINMLPGVTGINELKNSTLTIYPNPTAASVTINFNSPTPEKIKIVLTDITGKIVFVNENHNGVAGSNTISVNTSLLAKGIYLCRVITSEFVLQKLLQKAE
ncbi:MAG: T9SS type A sorting domain-containing protein [Bacteroidia bacterium]|nr:T9SS type A sorting domain-containing protein [Bacteroidia bacterium]